MMKDGSAHFLVNDGKLGWMGLDWVDPAYKRFDSVPEASPQTRGFAFVPILFLDQFEASSFGENDRVHDEGQRSVSSAFRSTHVTPCWRSSWKDAKRWLSSACCAGVTGS